MLARRVFQSVASLPALPLSVRLFSGIVEESDYFYSRVAVQKPAPNFKAAAVVDLQFKDISLSDYLGSWTVLFFYPLDWSFVCPTEVVHLL